MYRERRTRGDPTGGCASALVVAIVFYGLVALILHLVGVF